MASTEAVARRRAIRRLRSSAPTAEPTRATAVESRRARIAMALAWRHYHQRPAPDDLRRSWLFWQAIRCQVVKPHDFNRPAFANSKSWQWWCRLHWRQRLQLVRLTEKCTSLNRVGFAYDDNSRSADLLNSIAIGDVKMKW